MTKKLLHVPGKTNLNWIILSASSYETMLEKIINKLMLKIIQIIQNILIVGEQKNNFIFSILNWNIYMNDLILIILSSEYARKCNFTCLANNYEYMSDVR